MQKNNSSSNITPKHEIRPLHKDYFNSGNNSNRHQTYPMRREKSLLQLW